MGWGENDRGVSFTFGAEVIIHVLNIFDHNLISPAGGRQVPSQT